MATVSSVISTIKSFLTSKYLALSGGTLSGVIQTTTSNPMRRSVDDSFMEFFGATTYKNGAFIRLDGKDGPKPGAFSLATGNGTSNKFLLGYPNGSLTWDGKPVACIENYRSGNVWYRKYADGWIEQGNYWSLPGSNVTWDWTFAVPFIDQQYAFSIAQEVGSNSDSYNENVFCQYRSNTLFRLYNSATSYGSGGVSVTCCGYWK